MESKLINDMNIGIDNILLDNEEYLDDLVLELGGTLNGNTVTYVDTDIDPSNPEILTATFDNTISRMVNGRIVVDVDDFYYTIYQFNTDFGADEIAAAEDAVGCTWTPNIDFYDTYGKNSSIAKLYTHDGWKQQNK